MQQQLREQLLLRQQKQLLRLNSGVRQTCLKKEEKTIAEHLAKGSRVGGEEDPEQREFLSASTNIPSLICLQVQQHDSDVIYI